MEVHGIGPWEDPLAAGRADELHFHVMCSSESKGSCASAFSIHTVDVPLIGCDY